jgi:hypothetical protein
MGKIYAIARYKLRTSPDARKPALEIGPQMTAQPI